MYPFSTMNEIDYQNLLSVYVDAAFFPNLSKMDFMWVKFLALCLNHFGPDDNFVRI